MLLRHRRRYRRSARISGTAFFERKPAPGLIRGGYGLAQGKRVKTRIQSFVPIRSEPIMLEARTTARPRRLRALVGCGVVLGGRRPVRRISKKARDGSSPSGLYDFRDHVILPVICPTCQTIFEPLPNCIKCNGTVSINRSCFDGSSCKMKNPPPVFGAGFTISAMMPMCP